MRISTSMRWLVVAVSAAMLLAVAAACSSETIEVPGETVVVEKEVIKTVEVPGETVVKEVIKEVQVPGETVVVKEEVVKEVMVPGETVVVEKEVIKTVEVPGETVTKEVVKEVMVPGETVVVEKEVVKTVEVPGETVVVEKEVIKTVEVPGPERVMVKEVPGKKYVTDPATGKVVSAPEYGGTLNLARGYDAGHPDTWRGHGTASFATYVVEKLGIANWALDRDEFNFRTQYIPDFPIIGHLAESWEMPDDTTYILNIRKGVQWHDKAPMNGRELTAKDVEYNWHRYLGLGSGYTEGSPWTAKYSVVDEAGIESVEATDKYTVVFKLKAPNLDGLRVILFEYAMHINAPEVIKEHGNVEDWRNLVGTGPFEMTEWVSDTSLTYVKNPNYWGYDEKYPQNRLPYVDEIRALVIPDKATRVAALRAGKIDYLGFLNWTQINSIDTVESLGRTNPEIVAEPFFAEATTAFVLNATKPPFDDINVRRAIQMALDIETINVTYWKGWALTEPQGYTAAAVIGYVTPFEEWPEEVKQYYRYDPAGAEALLDAAGYPRGADGTRFKTNLIVRPSWDLSWYELAAEYFREIGVDVVEVEAVLDADWGTSVTEMTYEMAAVSAGNTWGKFTPMLQGVSTSEWNPLGVRDPAYDALVESAVTATTVEEQMRLSSEANMWLTKNHRYVWGGKSPKFSVTQPWVIGHNGEVTLSPVDYGPVFARLWIDSELKKAMGR